MSSKINLVIPGEVAACTRADVGKEVRLNAARGGVRLVPSSYVLALIILSQDQDLDVKNTAIKSLRTLPETTLLQVVGTPETHPRVLDILARLHFNKQTLLNMLLGKENLPQSTRTFLEEKAPGGQDTPEAKKQEVSADSSEAEKDGEEEKEVDEESEEFKSKYQLAQTLGVGEKIKVALTGDKEWRTLLIKDSNKLVSGAVVKNPRITEAEILAITKSVIQNEEILRVICMNKEWIKNYQIRKALALNTKTPLPNALRYLTTLSEKDLASIAKSKNISTVIATQARRFLATKTKH